MLEENKKDIMPDEPPVEEPTLGEEPAPREETIPQEEPIEAVPGSDFGDAAQETEDDADPVPLPNNVWKEAAAKEKRKRRRGIWIFIACVALLFAVIAIVGWGGDLFGSGGKQELPDEDDSASSIIDIFEDSKKTTIPHCDGDPSVRLVCAEENGDTMTAREIYAKVNPAVVIVVATDSDGGSVGTGVIMSDDGYIITNAHVISGGHECLVALSTGVTYDAMLVGMDEDEDLAVLKIDAKDLPTAEFGNSDLALVGDSVYAIGNPLGVELRGTMTDGIISAIDRSVEIDGKTMSVIQTNAALNNGNSGGPLINECGQVIGINTLKMGNVEGAEVSVEGLGFALPITSVAFVVNDLIALGKFRGVPTIGITVIAKNADDSTQVVVYEVLEGFGAAKAGIQPDDVILAADGREISEIDDLLLVRRTHEIGDTVALTIQRGDKTFDVDVVLYSDKKS
ncbi:MAG: trypsin-like peptidase domain-containing protein [Clostridiales bacterium]|nr:trypsin-like peptidase domain-containing protein [Candidatus Cacconaster stercorequi]